MTGTTHVPSTPETVQGGQFDPAAPPVARVEAGEVVRVDTVWPMHVPALTSRGLPRSAVLDDEIEVRQEVSREGPGPHWVTGPVHVEGAAPGDVLEVRVRDVSLRTDYAFNLFEPGIGVLPDAFEEADLAVVRLDRERGVASLGGGVEVPLDPFFGIVAVAPPEEAGPANTRPPSSAVGGNVDVRVLGEGSTLYFPVDVEGGRFFVGDGHATQGDGEVDGTALETSLTGTFEFAVHGDVPQLSTPIAETPTHYVVMGFDEDLDVALERAVRAAVGVLVQQEGLAPERAYRTCSVAADFAVSQAVNGTRGIHGLLPKSVFEGASGIDPRRFDGPVEWRG